MIKKITILTAILSIVVILFYVNMAHSHTNGSQGFGYTGSPGDGKNCSTCHASATTATSFITTNIPSGGYTGGASYTITCKPASGSCGFEITCEKSGGTKEGTFSSGTNLISNTSHPSCALTSSTASTWTLTWKAPAAGTGTVTFYACYSSSTSETAVKYSLAVNEACTAPTLIISPTNPSTCSGTPISLTASGTSTAYSWSTTGTTATVSVTPTTQTTYTVTGTLSGCTSTSNVTVSVTAKPATPVITQTTGVTLSSSASTGNQWYNSSSGIITGATGQTYTPTVNGTYYTIVTVNGCASNQSNSITLLNVGIPESEEANSLIRFYPNPADDKLMVVVPDAIDIKLSVYNIQGQLLIEQAASQKINQINISNLEKGIYLLKAESTKGIVLSRFIKD